jgi:hypothetical protein
MMGIWRVHLADWLEQRVHRLRRQACGPHHDWTYWHQQDDPRETIYHRGCLCCGWVESTLITLASPYPEIRYLERYLGIDYVEKKRDQQPLQEPPHAYHL